MPDVPDLSPPRQPEPKTALTEAETRARTELIARARAQCAAGETVDGEAVIEWLRSWGHDHELPAPRPTG